MRIKLEHPAHILFRMSNVFAAHEMAQMRGTAQCVYCAESRLCRCQFLLRITDIPLVDQVDQSQRSMRLPELWIEHQGAFGVLACERHMLARGLIVESQH